jgi:hypothetical protein
LTWIQIKRAAKNPLTKLIDDAITGLSQ